MPFHGRRMPPEHKHRFPPFLVQLLEQYQRFFSQAETAFLITIDDVERVLPPVGEDVIFLERSREHLFAGVFHTDTEGFEYLVAGATPRGRCLFWLLLLGLL